MPTDSEKHQLVFKNITQIQNFCTEIAGLLQIKTVFDPEYEHTQTLSVYDCIQ